MKELLTYLYGHQSYNAMDGYTAGDIACHHGLNAIQQQMQAQNSCNDFFYRFQITMIQFCMCLVYYLYTIA